MSVLERARTLHEEVETSERLAALLLTQKDLRKNFPRCAPLFDHAVHDVLQNLQCASRRLLDIYADADGLRAEELDYLAGCRSSTAGSRENDAQVWNNFYDALGRIRDEGKANAEAAHALTQQAEASQLFFRDLHVKAQDAVAHSAALKVFSPLEAMGLRVDMESLYAQYLNLKSVHEWRAKRDRQTEVARYTRILRGKESLTEDVIAAKAVQMPFTYQVEDYVTWLKRFGSVHPKEIPRYCKYNGDQYELYLTALIDYMAGYIRRVNPLADDGKINNELQSQFASAWAKRATEMHWWEPLTHRLELYSLPTDHIFSSAGTLAAHQNSKKYARALRELQELPVAQHAEVLTRSAERDEKLARLEFLVARYAEILNAAIQRTIDHLHEKQSQTWREQLEKSGDIAVRGNGGGRLSSEKLYVEGLDPAVLASLVIAVTPVEGREDDSSTPNGPLPPGEDDDDTSSKEDEDSMGVYNPRNLPVGWDGNPIPYWLYQLHGLNVEYKCEICGNFSYWGRRAFERHFHEWRHSFGMKCLGIPNSAHFKEITKIEDAILLWEKLRKHAQTQAFDAASQLVEYEDAQGNVYTDAPNRRPR